MWFFSVIFAKIASAGAIAQAATGAGIVLVGFTGVGAAGALPTPIQHGFTTVVAAISPVSGSDSPTDVTPAGESTGSTESTAPASSSAAEPTGVVPTETSTADSPEAPVSSTPKNHGQEVSSLAHERNAARKAAHKGGSDGSDDSGATSTEAHSAESEAPESESSDDAGEHVGSRESSHNGGEKSGRGGE